MSILAWSILGLLYLICFIIIPILLTVSEGDFVYYSFSKKLKRIGFTLLCIHVPIALIAAGTWAVIYLSGGIE